MLSMIPMIAFLKIQRRKRRKKEMARLIKLFAVRLVLIQILSSLRTRVKLHRAAIPAPSTAAINTLLECEDDPSWISLLGFDRAAFSTLYEYFEPVFASLWRAQVVRDRMKREGLDPRAAELDEDALANAAPSPRGKLGSLYNRMTGDCRRVLALVLFHLTTFTQPKVSCMLFGVSPSSFSTYLDLGLRTLNSLLQLLPNAAVVWPKMEKQQEFAGMIRAKYPQIAADFQPFGFVDGLNIEVKESGDFYEQNAYYNGWLSGTFVSGIFVYGPDGTVIWARVNMPGSWHDSQCARTLVEAIVETPNFIHEGFCIVGDTAFPRNAETQGRIVTPKKQDEMDCLYRARAPREEMVAMKILHRHATTVRQAAEWGMRQIQSGFARLRVPLPLDKDERRLLLDTCVLLHNFRMRTVGLSQIRTVYSPIWQQCEYVRLEKPKKSRPADLFF